MKANTYADAIDSRIVFRSYAVIAWLAGGMLLFVGPYFFPMELAGLPRAGGLIARILFFPRLLVPPCFRRCGAPRGSWP